jgi:hypothetical protein
MLSFPSSPRICLVLYGDPLHAKKDTHKKQSHHFILKQRASFLAKPDDTVNCNKIPKQFRTCVFGWARWLGALKRLIVDKLIACGSQMNSVATARSWAYMKATHRARWRLRFVLRRNKTILNNISSRTTCGKKDDLEAN